MDAMPDQTIFGTRSMVAPTEIPGAENIMSRPGKFAEEANRIARPVANKQMLIAGFPLWDSTDRTCLALPAQRATDMRQ